MEEGGQYRKEVETEGSFDNLGHVARRNSEGADGIITVMLLKLRFFGSIPAISLHRHAFALN